MPEAAAMVQANFSLPVGGAMLHVNVTVPAARTTLTQILPVLQNLDGALAGRVAQEAEAAGTPISCGPRCGACCRQMVPVSVFEAEALAEWMKKLPGDQRAALERRFHQALMALRDAGLIEKMLSEDWVVRGELVTELAIDYFRARVPCPFLENESCSIHAMRPLSCREYLVTSPPEFCKDPATQPVRGVQLPLKLSRALYAMGRTLEQDPRGWIPLVFLVAWAKSGARPGDRVAGTGEQVLRMYLEQLMGGPPKAEAAEGV
jgi:Fe-S-cluster containining protein